MEEGIDTEFDLLLSKQFATCYGREVCRRRSLLPSLIFIISDALIDYRLVTSNEN